MFTGLVQYRTITARGATHRSAVVHRSTLALDAGEYMPEDEPAIGDPDRVETAPLLASNSFYRALSERPRRRVLYYLLERDECSVDELADVLAGWETTTETMVAPDRRHQHELSLVHSHLPLLSEAGLVAYDSESGEVSLATVPEPAKALVRRAIEAETA
ncbi:DUF7344 domain-containing protein [Natronosalvus halobius]|uniref:DUF7344 domain-containing protein n=1 Tax=Natronosalvus halobius TaxID=2953746 RepID=UPI0020A161D9|nr:hypothetical protein [Natronosalvus halobius]USZ73326.1 hypothetical protein NGM15_08520 [Natronosalvus halobius]